ncbi:hypothetical protein [uncultured Dokdonia sp.]|uniref:hypothetical protein n=1 Tax=uncultured Dokdonia sp. TaxID=575653 RepID=UPI00261F6EBE|nr:hypothetical protein [uncultured Dokdonia sp.]
MNKNESYFGKTVLSEEKELKYASTYDITMDPREWMAKNGHRIICGDPRRYAYRNKELEAWIHKAFNALINEGIETLWKEFLTASEIKVVRELYENP